MPQFLDSIRLSPEKQKHNGEQDERGAKAERMVELATLRLRGFAPRAVSELEDLLTKADSESVRLAAARDLIDRGCGKAVERVAVQADIRVVKPW